MGVLFFVYTEIVKEVTCMVSILEEQSSGIVILELKKDNIRVEVSNYGCTILKVWVKDRNGKFCNVVLGMDSIDAYALRDGSYMGACVGRVANRIRKGHFVLNGKEYQLAINNGPNCLHGGVDGFSYRIFDYEILEDAVRFHYVSQDGEENFPGCLDLFVTYCLSEDGLQMVYEASSDADTIVNLTNHSYFNLSGSSCPIDEHVLMVASDQFGCVDKDGLFTGELRDVADSPFDFRKEKRMGLALRSEDEQIVVAHGLDHSFVFNQDSNQVVLYCESSGIEMRVSTSMPAAQIYSANFLSGKFMPQSAVCIETQYMPDEINLYKDARVILRANEEYKEKTVLQFGVRK